MINKKTNPGGRRGVAVAIICTVVIAAGIVYFYFLYPIAKAGPAQPIPFSHRLHVSVKEIACRFCHNTVGYTRYAGMPSVEKCLFCHEYVIPRHPYIEKLRGHLELNEPIAWEKVTWLPDHVYFSHQMHIRQGLVCTECHGQVETMDRVYRAKEFNMGFCLQCHQERRVTVDCIVCHQ